MRRASEEGANHETGFGSQQFAAASHIARQYRPVTSPHGASIPPPAYGIDFIDRQQKGASTKAQGVASIQPKYGDDGILPKRQQKNGTGLPDYVKSGIESLSGFDMSHVRVKWTPNLRRRFKLLS